MEMQLPVDLERLPEFRLLVNALKQKSAADVTAAEVEVVAISLWFRLWRDLCYLAQTTNQPGLLTAQGGLLFEQSLEPLFSDEARPLQLLVESGCLEVGKGTKGTEGTESERGWFCPRFAKLNAHMAREFEPRERKAAAASAIVRQKQSVAEAADKQLMLMPVEVFRRGDGTALDSVTARRCMLLVITLDRILRRMPQRSTSEYTDGLIADATAVVGRVQPETLDRFFAWLQLKRDQVYVPRTAEQVLAQFDELLAMANQN